MYIVLYVFILKMRHHKLSLLSAIPNHDKNISVIRGIYTRKSPDPLLCLFVSPSVSPPFDLETAALLTHQRPKMYLDLFARGGKKKGKMKRRFGCVHFVNTIHPTVMVNCKIDKQNNMKSCRSSFSCERVCVCGCLSKYMSEVSSS